MINDNDIALKFTIHILFIFGRIIVFIIRIWSNSTRPPYSVQPSYRVLSVNLSIHFSRFVVRPCEARPYILLVCFFDSRTYGSTSAGWMPIIFVLSVGTQLRKNPQKIHRNASTPFLCPRLMPPLAITFHYSRGTPSPDWRSLHTASFGNPYSIATVLVYSILLYSFKSLFLPAN